MLYKEYTIKLVETSKLSDFQGKIVRLAGGSFHLYQDKAALYPWVAAVSILRVFQTSKYRPGLAWCSDFAVGAETPQEALKLAKRNIDAREKPQFEIF